MKVESENSVFDSRDDCNAIIVTSTNDLISGCKKTIIPHTIESVAEDAFNGCIDLTSIVIPSRVSSVGYRAFYGCI